VNKIKKGFFNSPRTIWGIAPSGDYFLFSFYSMNNKFINNNGATLLHTKNKKTKVESQIEALKQQEQEIVNELLQCSNYLTASHIFILLKFPLRIIILILDVIKI